MEAIICTFIDIGAVTNVPISAPAVITLADITTIYIGAMRVYITFVRVDVTFVNVFAAPTVSAIAVKAGAVKAKACISD